MIFAELRKSQGFWEKEREKIVSQKGNQMWDQHLLLTKKWMKI